MNTALPFSPAADRNKVPILEKLAALLPAQARVLEVASGSGQHAEHFARAQPLWHWQPTDADPAMPVAIDERCAGLAHVAPALHLDVLAWPWPAALAAGGPYDAVYCANMIHIAPWACCGALMRGAVALLAPAGLLVVYGPFRVDGVPTSAGNEGFDADLRARNPAWGLRWLHDVQGQAEAHGLALERSFAMPANNLMLVFSRRGAASA